MDKQNEHGLARFSEFIGCVYEASYRPGLWPDVMEQLCQLMEARSALVVVNNKRTGRRKILCMHGINKLIGAAYNAGVGRYDTTFSIMSGHEVMVIHSEDFLDKHPAYFRFILKPSDIGYMAALNAHNDSEIQLGVAVHKSFNSPGFTDDDLITLRLIAPHISRAFLIQSKFENQSADSQSLLSLLSKMTMGVFLVGDGDHVVYVNPVAEKILSHQQQVTLVDSQLKFSDKRLKDLFFTELQQTRTAEVSSALSANHLTPLPIYDDRGNLRLVFYISLLAGGEAFGVALASSRLVLVCIADPDSAVCFSEQQIMELFKLTEAEAKVVVALVNGLSVQQIAERHQVAVATVRSQMKAVFAKMGVGSQQEVIRRVMNMLPPTL